MRWLALVLIALNGVVWYASDLWVPDSISVVSGQQTLPRVADLKLKDDVVQDPVPALEDPTPSAGVIEKKVASAKTGPQESNNEVAQPQVQSQCIELGWFDSPDLAMQAYLALGEPGANVRTLEVERILEPLHWVIIPPQPEPQALEMFRELQRRGIDSYLVTQGDNRNAISLGLFQSLDAAKGVLAQKKRQNLNAVLAKFPRNQISYALVFEAIQSSDSEAGKARIRDFQNDFEMVEIGPCEGIATTPENP